MRVMVSALGGHQDCLFCVLISCFWQGSDPVVHLFKQPSYIKSRIVNSMQCHAKSNNNVYLVFVVGERTEHLLIFTSK